MTEIPFADPGAGFAQARQELVSAFEAVLDSGRYILGPNVSAFEEEWARYCGVPHAVGASSGTDALALALSAIGVRSGDEVLVPAMTALATWMAVAQIGAVPVGVDVAASGGIDPGGVPAALGPRTRAVVAVHLYGQPADVARLTAAASVPVVEDAAQAHGARVDGRPVGSLGTAAAWSFYPTKNLAAVGDAGAVTTADADVAERVRLLREYGWRTRDDSEVKGFNARLDELQAALLRVMLRHLDGATARRRTIADAYLDGLSTADRLELPPRVAGTDPAWHLFVARHPRRDALRAALDDEGIGTAVHYAPPPHLTTAFRADGWKEGDFPVAERHARTALSLPLHAAMTDRDVERVIEAVRSTCVTLAVR